MYQRAKSSSAHGHQIQFYEFYEWIHNDINRVVYDRNANTGLQLKTGLESAKKEFQPKIGQIKFGTQGEGSKDVSSKGSDSEIQKRSSFGNGTLKSKPMSGTGLSSGVGDRVQKMLNANMKLGDIKARKPTLNTSDIE